MATRRSPASDSRRSGDRLGRAAATGLLLLLAMASAAEASRWDWSGSVAIDYQKLLDTPDAQGLTQTGFITELAIKATVDVNDHITVNAKVCTSCHGIMIDQGYAEVRLTRQVNFELGRVNVPFGDYYLRHDPASDVLASRPLPYAMGRMIRYQPDQFNLGVLPMPYVDSGVTLFGDVWIRDHFQFWYSAYAVNGFRNSSSANDFDFMEQTGQRGVHDNNDDPSFGGRLSLARGPFAVGGSYLWGRYDLAGAYEYDVWGIDASMLLDVVRLRFEYLERNTDLNHEGARESLRKDGFYLQAELPLSRHLELIGRFDGLLREAPPSQTMDESSGIVRGTVALNLLPSVDWTVRAAWEHWRFTDFEDVDVVHLGAVVAF